MTLPKNEVLVSPQITIEDLNIIKSAIEIYDRKHNINLINKNLLLFFTDNVKSRQELIEKYCDYLFRNGYVNENYYNSVQSRLKINDTYVARGIAVPHGLPENVIQSTILIIILERPIKWGENIVQIVLFVVTNNEYHQEFNYLLRKIMRIASSNEKTKQLLKCQNEIEVYEIIKNA